VTPQKDVPVVNVEETAGGTTASAPPPPLYVLPRTSTPLAGKGVKMTAASICVHGNQAERCEVCDAGGTPVLGVRGAAEYEDANSLTASGPMAIFKPQLAYVEPALLGFTVADSSMRLLVRNWEPTSMMLAEAGFDERGGHMNREVWLYSTPGAAAVAGATQWKCSTFAWWWRHHAACQNLFRFYVVPAFDSLAGSWGNQGRAKTMRALFQGLVQSGRIGTTITVKQAVERGGMTIEEAFVGSDSFHMNIKGTLIAHQELWKAVAVEHRPFSAQIPVLVWDFNATTAHVKSHWDDHLHFWENLTAWGASSGQVRIDWAAVVDSSLGPAYPIEPFYKINGFQPGRAVPESLSEATWHPFATVSRVATGNTFFVSKSATLRKAAKEKWRSENEEEFWFECYRLATERATGTPLADAGRARLTVLLEANECRYWLFFKSLIDYLHNRYNIGRSEDLVFDYSSKEDGRAAVTPAPAGQSGSSGSSAERKEADVCPPAQQRSSSGSSAERKEADVCPPAQQRSPKLGSTQVDPEEADYGAPE